MTWNPLIAIIVAFITAFLGYFLFGHFMSGDAAHIGQVGSVIAGLVVAFTGFRGKLF